MHAACNLKPALDISFGLIGIQRHKVGAERNSLLQLPQADGVEFVIQFGLSDKENLKQLLLCSLKIAQEPDLFQNFRRKVMRFVDHQGRRQLSLASVNDIIGNLKQQFTLVPGCDRKPQIIGEVLQELHGGETAIEDVSVADIFTLLQQVQQIVKQKSLASSHFSGQDHNSLMSPDAVVEG